MSTTDSQRRVIRCAHCGAKMRIPAAAAGRGIRCPRCQQQFRVPAAQPTEPPPDRIEVACAACGARLRVPSRAAGKRIRCPRCGQGVTVAAPAAPPGGTDDPLSELDDKALEAIEQSGRPVTPPATPTTQVRPCPHCGSPVVAGVRLCAHCGRDVERTSRAAAGAALGTLGAVGKRAGTILLGTLLSVVGATIGAVIWALVAYRFNYELGWIAWGLGVLAGLGMYVGHRDYSPLAGFVAAGIALVGILVAKVIIFVAVIYAVITGDTSNPEYRRQALIVRIAQESLDKHGITPGSDDYDVLWDAAVKDAERQVKPLSDDEVQKRLDVYLAEEAEEAEDEAAAVTAADAAPAAADEPNAPPADEGIEVDSSAADVLKLFFVTMFGFMDILFVFLALASAYRFGCYGWAEKRS